MFTITETPEYVVAGIEGLYINIPRHRVMDMHGINQNKLMEQIFLGAYNLGKETVAKIYKEALADKEK